MALLFIDVVPTGIGFSILGLTMVGQLVTLANLRSRFKTIQRLATEGYDNALMEQPYTGYCDDVSSVELALIMKKA
jgi:methyl-accepting chemotaxis protein